MTRRLYLDISISLVILFIGYNFATQTSNYWENLLIHIASLISASLFLTGFKTFPKKVTIEIDYKYLFPIFAGVIGVFLANNFVYVLIAKLLNWNFNEDSLKLITNLPRFLIKLLVFVFLEELYFRRVIAQKILNEKSFSKAIWISALIFGLSHLYSDTGILYAFFAGLMLAYIFLKTKSLLLSFLAHLAYNLLVYFFTSKLNEFVEFEHSYLTITSIILFSLLLIAVMLYMFKSKDGFQNKIWR